MMKSKKQYRLLKESRLFDEVYYLLKNPDIRHRDCDADALSHFISHGWKEKRNPCLLFDISYYLLSFPFNGKPAMNPLLHYLESGWKENKNPHLFFNTRYYLDTNPGLRESGAEPLSHYLESGWKNRLNPHPLFDAGYYLKNSPELIYSDKEPLSHYLETGWRYGLNPNPLFDVSYYMQNNPGLMESGAEPLSHYLLYGWREGQNPHPLFDAGHYLQNNPDIRASGAEPLSHYLVHGWREGRNPHPLFDIEYYLNTNPDIKEAGTEPLGHYLQYGWKKYSRPHAMFDIQYYLDTSPDIRKAGIEPLAHYWNFGWKENRDPNPLFDVQYYLETCRDVKEAGMEPLWHYFLYGWKEGRNPNPRVKNCSYSYHFIKPEDFEFKHKPLISIIMPVYNVDPGWLDRAVKSVEDQIYTNWELCIADDASDNQATLDYLQALDNPKIKISFLRENRNISEAGNEALSLASGEYAGFLDNDDELTEDALFEMVKAINDTGADLIYSDEDKLEMDGSFSDPHYKPDFCPELFLSQNYINHFCIIRRSLIDRAGGFEPGLEGAQDYDLYLKVLELSSKIYHIPKVLYHWRKIPGSCAAVFSEKSYAGEAGRKALGNALKRRGIDACVINGLTGGTYKVCYRVYDEPLVSIIIPFKDKPEVLEACINSITARSTYKNYEIIMVSNNSCEEKTFQTLEKILLYSTKAKLHEYNMPFNYSGINNYAVRSLARGEFIIFLNNDVEIITPSWIEELLMYARRDDIGAAGAKLYYPDDTVQHAGMVIVPMTDHKINCVFQRAPREDYGYFSRLKCINNYYSVTGACMMVERKKFEEAGGFDENNLRIAYNDVDLCLALYRKGYRNIYNPFCEAYHHESLSRGYEESLEEKERSRSELYALEKKHPGIFSRNDPHYNINLSSYKTDFSFNEVLNYKNFREEIIKEAVFYTDRKRDSVCIFSHFDEHGIIDDYVVYYIKRLSQLFDIIFVSTAENLNDKQTAKIEKYCMHLIVKRNYGYDFGAWKSGYDRIDNLSDYKKLLLANDSVYGPFYDLSELINSMDTKDYDVYSVTDNYQVKYHLQSYFILYNKSVFNSTVFTDFWKNQKIYSSKQDLIYECEISFTKKLINAGFKIGAYYSSRNRTFLNIMHYYWKDLLENKRIPFIKRELLRDNPVNIDISGYKEIIKKTGYPLELIEKNLQRLSLKR